MEKTECYGCGEVQQTRHYNLFVRGSEGCNLCLVCQIEIVDLLRSKHNAAIERKKQEFIVKRDKKHKDSCGAAGFAYPKEGECIWCSKRPGLNLDAVSLNGKTAIKCDGWEPESLRVLED